jgi:hypothetical protein
VNYEFPLDDWLPRFPLRERHNRYSGGDITSPCDLCNIEWLRRGMVDQYDWGRPVPVDVFVMSKGEPENRFATKIGGLPYRPRNLPWPCTPTGRPLALVAQFNFTNSTDIVGDLPGDLLLVFGDNSGGMIQPLHMEWQSLGIQDLARPVDMPGDCMTIAPCFGNRCRMNSYPDAVRITDSKYPQCQGKDVWSHYCIPQLQATQIGRAPYFIQAGDDSLPGQPLCTIASVQPDKHQPYPWVNVPEPLCRKGERRFDGGELMIGDLGCIYIFIEEDGTLHSSESCY